MLDLRLGHLSRRRHIRTVPALLRAARCCDVESGRADFTDILVYDVSRWGRSQDADESAYYEYIGKRANIRVHYCAAAFAIPRKFVRTRHDTGP